MFLPRYPFLLVRTASLAVWALVAFSAVAWGLRLTRADIDIANPVAVPMSATPDLRTAARSLGALPAAAVAAPTLASRFQLLGVLSGGTSQGAALIAVDGKPARPYRVGRVVVDDLVLQSAQGRRVSLGPSVQGPATLTLELPAKK
jgi:general secretion pathway protein C